MTIGRVQDAPLPGIFTEDEARSFEAEEEAWRQGDISERREIAQAFATLETLTKELQGRKS